jgi:hypothetical protein
MRLRWSESRCAPNCSKWAACRIEKSTSHIVRPGCSRCSKSVRWTEEVVSPSSYWASKCRMIHAERRRGECLPSGADRHATHSSHARSRSERLIRII